MKLDDLDDLVALYFHLLEAVGCHDQSPDLPTVLALVKQLSKYPLPRHIQLWNLELELNCSENCEQITVELLTSFMGFYEVPKIWLWYQGCSQGFADQEPPCQEPPCYVPEEILAALPELEKLSQEQFSRWLIGTALSLSEDFDWLNPISVNLKTELTFDTPVSLSFPKCLSWSLDEENPNSLQAIEDSPYIQALMAATPIAVSHLDYTG